MRHTIILPDLGQTTGEARVLKWLKQPGEVVSRGEPLLEVATDKVDMEVEAFESGYLREHLAAEGSLVAAFAPLAVLTDTPDEPFERVGEAAPAETPAPAAAPAEAPARAAGAGAAPAARALARELGVDLAAVEGSGPGGLITRADVQAFARGQEGSGAHFRALARMAATVEESRRTIPHFHVWRDVSMAAAAEWRREWNRGRPDLPASYNDVFVRAASCALADVPALNISLCDGVYRQRSSADVLVVAARDAALVLAPVPDPGRSSWEEFLRRIRRAVAQGTPDQAAPLLAVSNLGMHGVTGFTAIIPPGCTAVLAVGAVREKAVMRDGRPAGEPVCTLTLSADHRVAGGVAAAQFLERMQYHLDHL